MIVKWELCYTYNDITVYEWCANGQKCMRRILWMCRAQGRWRKTFCQSYNNYVLEKAVVHHILMELSMRCSHHAIQYNSVICFTTMIQYLWLMCNSLLQWVVYKFTVLRSSEIKSCTWMVCNYLREGSMWAVVQYFDGYVPPWLKIWGQR